MTHIPQKAIDKAMEGGWKQPQNYQTLTGDRNVIAVDYPWASIIADRSFWQALVKACGWSEKACMECGFNGRFDDYHGDCGKCMGKEYKGWERQALFFYNLILLGKDTTEFWEEILK